MQRIETINSFISVSNGAVRACACVCLHMCVCDIALHSSVGHLTYMSCDFNAFIAINPTSCKNSGSAPGGTLICV